MALGMQSIARTLGVEWRGLFAEVLGVMKDWAPTTLPTERDYQGSLVSYLREKFPGARVDPEYRHNGTTADLMLSWSGIFTGTHRVYFELKRNLTRKAEFDRLVGQIEDLKPSDNSVVVVLCGQCDPQYVERLRERYAESTGGLFGHATAIVEKQA